jgi:hypothetical protein
MKFGDFYHILHHVHEILEIAKEKLEDETWETSEEVAFYAALKISVDERLEEMEPYEKFLTVRQASEFKESQESLVERAMAIPVQGTSAPQTMGDLLDELLRYYFLFYAYLLEGKVPPWEPV